MTHNMNETPELKAQWQREQTAKQQAMKQHQTVVYTDIDGCEVTVTPLGHVFYNVGDWY